MAIRSIKTQHVITRPCLLWNKSPGECGVLPSHEECLGAERMGIGNCSIDFFVGMREQVSAMWRGLDA